MKTARHLYDVAQVFESLEGPHERVRRALEILHHLVPYDRCALLEAQPARDRRLVIAPPPTTPEDAALQMTLDEMLALLSERDEPRVQPQPSGRPPALLPAHLAVPLVGLDQVIGLLFVGRAGPPYEEHNLCLLSVVAAQIATYLTMLRLHEERDELLAMLSHELRTPLTAVLGWAQLLSTGSVATPARAAEAIARNATALGRRIEDLVNLSRIDTGKLAARSRARRPGSDCRGGGGGRPAPGRGEARSTSRRCPLAGETSRSSPTRSASSRSWETSLRTRSSSRRPAAGSTSAWITTRTGSPSA